MTDVNEFDRQERLATERRLREHDAALQTERIAEIRAAQREQTAATILAALLQMTQDVMIANHIPADLVGPEDMRRALAANVEQAVQLADALRAELAKGKP